MSKCFPNWWAAKWTFDLWSIYEETHFTLVLEGDERLIWISKAGNKFKPEFCWMFPENLKAWLHWMERGGSPELTCDRDHIGQTVRIFILMYLCIFVLVWNFLYLCICNWPGAFQSWHVTGFTLDKQYARHKSNKKSTMQLIRDDHRSQLRLKSVDKMSLNFPHKFWHHVLFKTWKLIPSSTKLFLRSLPREPINQLDWDSWGMNEKKDGKKKRSFGILRKPVICNTDHMFVNPYPSKAKSMWIKIINMLVILSISNLILSSTKLFLRIMPLSPI